MKLKKYRKAHVKTIPTIFLKQIVANEGYNEQRTRDYGPQLDEIINEINRRCQKADSEAMEAFMKLAEDKEHNLRLQGKTCVVCDKKCHYEHLDRLFYKKLGKYRNECKECTKDKVREARRLAKITEIPF